VTNELIAPEPPGIDGPAERYPDFTYFFMTEFRPLTRKLIYFGAEFDEASGCVTQAMVEVARRWHILAQPYTYAYTRTKQRFLAMDVAEQRVMDAIARAVGSAQSDKEYRALLELQQTLQALAKLPDDERTAIRWSLVGYTEDEIALRTRRQVGEIRTILTSARVTLAGLLNPRSRPPTPTQR
jgi:DNA-directed RNA polymerase specialized sigma24 family protein